MKEQHAEFAPRHGQPSSAIELARDATAYRGDYSSPARSASALAARLRRRGGHVGFRAADPPRRSLRLGQWASACLVGALGADHGTGGVRPLRSAMTRLRRRHQQLRDRRLRYAIMSRGEEPAIADISPTLSTGAGRRGDLDSRRGRPPPDGLLAAEVNARPHQVPRPRGGTS